jgi:hypothetical protein
MDFSSFFSPMFFLQAFDRTPDIRGQKRRKRRKKEENNPFTSA